MNCYLGCSVLFIFFGKVKDRFLKTKLILGSSLNLPGVRDATMELFIFYKLQVLFNFTLYNGLVYLMNYQRGFWQERKRAECNL